MSDSAEPGGRRGDAPRSGAGGDDTFAELLSGFTLDSGRKRRRRHKHDDAEPEAEQQPGDVPEWPAAEPDRPQAADSGAPGSDPSGSGPLFEQGGYPDDLGDTAALIRPYQWTGGRTKATMQLGLETLVSTSEAGGDDGALRTVEHRTVARLCRHPHAVAEVAAKLSVPLGVARVLLSDMAEQGLIMIHQTVADDDAAAHLALMERVLSGLRRL